MEHKQKYFDQISNSQGTRKDLSPGNTNSERLIKIGEIKQKTKEDNLVEKVPFLEKLQGIHVSIEEKEEPRFNFVEELKNVKVSIPLVQEI